MREREVERQLVNEVHKRGGIAWKFTSPGTGGVPDRIVLMPGGNVAFVELKAPGRKPRSLQLHRIRQLRKLGIKVFVIDDSQKIKEVLNEIYAS